MTGVGRAYAPHLKLTDYATRCAICKRIFVSDAAFDAHGPDDYLDTPNVSSADVSADFCPAGLSVRPCPRSRRGLEFAKAARSMALGTKEGGRAREIPRAKAMSERDIRMRDMRKAKMDRDARDKGKKAAGRPIARPIARKKIREHWAFAESPPSPSRPPQPSAQPRATRASGSPKKSADSTGAGRVLRFGSESYFPCKTCNRTFYSNLDRVRHHCPNRPKVECAGAAPGAASGAITGAISGAITDDLMDIGESVKMRRRSGRR